MHICIIADGYPSAKNSNFTFIHQLCVELANLGLEISVIVPQSISKHIVRKKPLEPKYSVFYTEKNNPIFIYRPYVFTLGNTKGLLKKGVDLIKKIAIRKSLKKFKQLPDVFYGHFWHNAYLIYEKARETKIPLFVASGESVINFHKLISDKTLKKFSEYVNGVICVSSKNFNESIEKKLTTKEKCIVLPNAVNLDLFQKKDKIGLRKKFGFKKDSFIIAFVGGFIERKGANRIAEAVKLLNDKNIKSIFIGGGITQKEFEPNCDGILFKGELPHHEIPDYLNCADVYVLPTLHEGSNNSIIEAMACGLPVISSDLSFNYDILDKSYAIFINPLDIIQIANAIKHLKNNPILRIEMGNNALSKSKNFDIKTRAKNIQKFIEHNLDRIN